MIEKLTELKMVEYDFGNEQIEKLLNWDNYEINIQNSKGFFFASNIEGKIYTGKEAIKKVRFKDKQNAFFPFEDLSLVPDYFELIEAAYIEEQKKVAGSIFNEQATKEKFRLKEIDKTISLIKGKNDENKMWKYQPKFIENSIAKHEHYLQWLNDKVTTNHPNKEQKIEAPFFKPKLFKDLFYKPEIIDKCLNLLRETDKPCINEEKKYLRNKGAFIVWFNALEYKKIFNFSFCNDIERAETLNINFEGLNISESLFRQGNKRATENYKDYFESAIAAIKH
jgi:hypothetical protein